MCVKVQFMVLPLPMSIPSPDLQFLQIGPLRIYFYALCILTGIVCAAIWTGSRLSKRGGERGAVIDFTVWSVVLGIVGARIYHVLTHWGFYFAEGRQWWNPFERDAIWNIWDGGIAIFGALIGGGIGVWVASRITGITPASISLLMVHLKKGGFKEFAVAPATPTKAEGEVAA